MNVQGCHIRLKWLKSGLFGCLMFVWKCPVPRPGLLIACWLVCSAEA